MSRKHFILIAAAIRNNITDRAQREAIALAMLPALRAANERFNTGKFMEAAVGE